jgi:hypothetical protein
MGGCRSQVLIATGFNVPDRVEDPDGPPDNQLADADEVNVGESLDRPPDVLKGEACYFARSCPSALSQFSR